MGRRPTTRGRRGRGRLDWDDSTSSETLRSGDAELVSGRTIWHDFEAREYMVSLAPIEQCSIGSLYLQQNTSLIYLAVARSS